MLHSHQTLIASAMVLLLSRSHFVHKSNVFVFGFCPSVNVASRRLSVEKLRNHEQKRRHKGSRLNSMNVQKPFQEDQLQAQIPKNDTFYHIPTILEDTDFGMSEIIFDEEELSPLLTEVEYQRIHGRDVDSNDDINCAHSLSLEVCAIPDDKVNDDGIISIGKVDDLSSKLDAFLDDKVMSTYLGPRIVLAIAACLYGTNCPLGAVISDSIPPSAFTCSRMVLASLTFLLVNKKLHPSLIGTTLLAGCFTSLGYVTQSIALIDTSPATVSFLGALTVVVCPLLEFIVDKRPMGWKDAPQIWISSILCLAGVGVLEFYDPNTALSTPSFLDSHNQSLLQSVGIGDILAIVQAFGFGTGIFLSSKMMRQYPDQSLPITSVMVGTVAFWSMIWCFFDGWIGGSDDWMSYTLPGMLFPSSSAVGFDHLLVVGGIIWTGVVSTSGNFYVENVALGKVPTAEASVLLGTEPLWAAVFSSILLGETFGSNDIIGGFFITIACLVSTIHPKEMSRLLRNKDFTKL